MLYITGGLAYGEVDETYSEGVVGGPVSNLSPLDASRLDRWRRR
jgi:hypothetical protein